MHACQGAWAGACACARVASLVQRATRMRHIVSSFVVSLALPNSSTLSQKRQDFRKTVTDHKMCVLLSLQLLSEKCLTLRKVYGDIVIKVKTCSCKVPVLLVGF